MKIPLGVDRNEFPVIRGPMLGLRQLVWLAAAIVCGDMAGCAETPGAPRSPQEPLATVVIPVVAPAAPAVGATEVLPREPDVVGEPRVQFVMAIMSMCPYANKAIPAVKQMRDALGTDVEIVVEYVGDVDSNGKLSSMHGADEVQADLWQVCTAKMFPRRLIDLLACQADKGYRNAASTGRQCLGELGLPVAPIAACASSDEGRSLLAESFHRAQANGMTASPTFSIAGERYTGDRSTQDFLRAVCAGLSPPHRACDSVPDR